MLTVFKKDVRRVGNIMSRLLQYLKKFCMPSVTTNLAEPHSYHWNGHLTVAGEATSRSMGSKIRLICGDIWMISPLMRQSFLLSSSTVFMFSIHTASTGPSKISHFLSGLWWRGSRQSLQMQIEQSNFNFAVCALCLNKIGFCTSLLLFFYHLKNVAHWHNSFCCRTMKDDNFP